MDSLRLVANGAWDAGQAGRDRAPARRLRRYQRELAALRRCGEVAAVPDRAWRARLIREGLHGTLRTPACAIVDAACRRSLGLVPFDTQWLAALAMLDGHLVEMATGEGKTLATGLAAAVAALAGRRVHVITANDYLVERDSVELLPLFRQLGLRLAAARQDADEEARRRAYRAEVVYACAKTVAFDWLRDVAAQRPSEDSLEASARRLLAPQGPEALLPTLDTVFVDEADSVLIDEAQVPLILSAPRREAASRRRWWEAGRLAAKLEEGRHFTLDRQNRRASLTAAGAAALAGESATDWLGRQHRQECVETAVAAKYLYRRDHDYVLRDGEVCIVDPVTGRIAEGRLWSRGLHALVALKEGLPPPAEPEVVARTTFQKFFPRYRCMGGMSGTLTESAREFARCYRLKIVKLPLRSPCRRAVLPPRPLAGDDPAVAEALVGRLREPWLAGRPVLVGTDSVAHSTRVSGWLRRAGIAHRVLNAEQSREEARIVAEAGLAASVTVATNMAGRGTDIRLGDGVAERGGLHVISLQINPSRRLDRQLEGRCARLGDPGSCERWLVAESMAKAGVPLTALTGWLLRAGWQRAAALLAGCAVRLHQLARERRGARARSRLIAQDEWWDKHLVMEREDTL